MNHEFFMREAIRLSLEGMRKNAGGPFGAVIVKDNQILGKGHNRVIDTNDPTAHAEVVAIRDACKNIEHFNLSGAVIYSSCEPCPMCLAAIYWARIEKIIYANTTKDAADVDFDDLTIYQEIQLPIESRLILSDQLLRDEALQAFEEWRAKPDKTIF